jgi:hypothetical protein
MKFIRVNEITSDGDVSKGLISVSSIDYVYETDDGRVGISIVQARNSVPLDTCVFVTDTVEEIENKLNKLTVPGQGCVVA